jgi:hypothetical protein
MLTYPFDLSFQALQPLVVLDGDVFVKTRRGPARAELVTALGVVHPLRRFCSAADLAGHHRRLNGEQARRMVQAEMVTRLHSGGYTDTLRFFVEHLVPAFARRDQGEDCLDGTPPAGAEGLDLIAEAAAIAEDLPPPRPPSPSLWLCGRVWNLTPGGGREGTLHVRQGEKTFGLGGSFTLVRALMTAWQQQIKDRLAQAIARIEVRIPPRPPDPELTRAREELARQRYVQRGDLLYLPGEPPRLAHVLPPHKNHVLGRFCERDLAIAAPLHLPPRITGPHIVVKTARGWERYRPPNGLCLGGSAPAARPESPGVALAAYLRWAAQRIASNGRFHSSDGENDTPF